jgi:pSer/pThr/pTyr-binding forkhead associated (FHA) protein
MASLTIVVDGTEQRFPLEAAAVTLGRGLESDIRLKDIKASRRHCQIVKTPKGYQCVDLSSGNGTYVNGVQIKSQILGSGDKITIGSTTIAFEEAPSAPKASPAKPAPARTGTGKMPAAPAAAPVSSKAATAKIPTERVQVAPTKKITAKVEAVKAPSQGGLKPAPQPPGRPAGRAGKPTARTGSPRPPRPAGDVPKKKSPVALMVIVAVVVLLLAGGGYFLFGSRNNDDLVRAQIEQLMKKAHDAEAAEHYDAAVLEYRKALDLCQGDRYKMRASDIQKQIQQIEARRASGTGTGTPPKRDPRETPEKGPDFQARKAEIAEKYKLSGDPAAADWGGAVREWNDFLKSKPAGDGKAKADGEIRAIQGNAKEDLGRLRKKAEALAQENKMAEALDLLKQQVSRFENTELQAELETAIKQYDK